MRAFQLPDHTETPCYVYDLDELRRSCERLSGCLPQPSEVYYALKANPHPEVVRGILRQGVHAEVSSPGELDIAVSAGADMDRLLYTGPAKRAVDVRYALSQGVRRFSVDSGHGVRQLAMLAEQEGKEVDFLLRGNPPRARAASGLLMTGVPTQFGADHDLIAAEARAMTSYPAARLTGVHLYLATNIETTDGLLEQFRIALDTALMIQRKTGRQLAVLDLGGGFAAPYATAGALPAYDHLADRLGELLDETFPGWRDGAPRIAFESGRYLTATAGTLYTTVLDVKQSHGERVVVVDSGIHHLGGMTGLRRVVPLQAELGGGDPNDPTSPARVCGSLCTPLDKWSTQHPLPAVDPGDILHVRNVGAYGLSASLALFLSHPMPLELVIEDGEVCHASRLVTERREVPYQATEMTMDDRFVQALRPHLPFLKDGYSLRSTDSLRDLGLDSLGAIEIHVALEETFQVTIPDDKLVDETFATVGSLWQVVDDARIAESPA